MGLYLDGKLTAHVRTGETTTLTVPVGSRILGAGPAGEGMCAWANEATHTRETSHVVEPGSRTKVRLPVMGEGIYQVKPTGF